ncbi:selenocysteine-specific translation elongation factor [Trichlorobacter ammonificans]|uniref:Selenocysteine-specific elongation factor n=1 Tax=Trichlorobacter ammonificans TaxID=2916410 RepID=A0ABN8HC18_9BACT|nr:selenocysteine-specific translation elongation factor [Trichlorobacter ammonificans]CAH2030236.1 Selenocysteine-specific elongation factor [Trichlorobacter ammonificans]
MKHLILGTAGHIDHGKTSLVKALTGIDTDRLKEEKVRGITIELGFAHLELPGDITFGIVDVPGHERFIRTMVAGVAGMDLVMLVIAADEGIMPQTREHLDILRLLGVKRGLVVLTKRDRVEQDWLELVTEEVREFVTGTFLEGAPIIAVSSRSGEGLACLTAELARLAEGSATKDREGNFRLPVDRVFTVAGFGTVVTGTLLAGTVTVGDELELLPSGHRGRVRGIQVHGSAAEQGHAGQRLAINLQGIALDQVARGDVVVPPAVFRTTRRVDVRLDHLVSAPRALRHRARVRLHAGTREVAAQVVLLDQDRLKAGETAYAQFRLAEPLLLVSGDLCLLRTVSPAATIGGAMVLDPFPPARRRRGSDALALLAALDAAEHQRTCALIVSQSLLSGISLEEILLRSGIPRRQAETALQQLLARGELVQMTREPRMFLSAAAVASLKQLLGEELAAFMTATPLASGISREELKSRLPRRSDPRFFASLLADLEQEGTVVTDRELVRLPGFVRRSADDHRTMAGRICVRLAERGCEPPLVKELAASLGCTEKECRAHLATLVREGLVSRVASDLYYDTAVLDGIREQLVGFLRERNEITPAEFRDLTGLSRKFMIPMLEYFDQQKVTIRVGDKRVLRSR